MAIYGGRADLQKFFPIKPTVWPTNIVQAGAPHSAELDSRMTEVTESVAYRMVGNNITRSFTAPAYTVGGDPGVGGTPLASLTAVNTWTDFLFTTGAADEHTFELPYRLSESYDHVTIAFTLATTFSGQFGFRVQGRTLAGHTVATSTGVVRTGRARSPVQDVTWVVSSAFGGSQYHGFSGSVAITPTVDATTRRVSIVPQALLNNSVYASVDLGQSVLIYLKQITIIEGGI